MAKQYIEDFKKDAVRYWKEHPELGINKCAKNLGISKSALSSWGKAYEENEGAVPTRGRGNYESDEAKENARLRKELRDTQEALEILKKRGLKVKVLMLDREDAKDADEYLNKYVHTLGNLTITGYNSNLSNFDFETIKTRNPLCLNFGFFYSLRLAQTLLV